MAFYGIMYIKIHGKESGTAGARKKKWQEKIKELDAMKKEKPESIWKKDLISLENTLKKEGLI